MTQHYLFAFRLLPPLLDSNPRLTREHLLAPHFVDRLWRHAALHSQQLSASGTPQVETFGDVLLIRMPPPSEPPEAYFLAIIGDEPQVYTLELGQDFVSSEPCTYFCGCTASGHNNYGPGPVAEVGAFLAALAGIR